MKLNLIKKNIFFEIKKQNLIFFLKKIKISNFFMIDGPPFSNGKIHIGHVLNKILKDIFIKNFLINNFICINNFGWDCHGLPIEQKIFSKKNYYFNCREFVCKTIISQKKDFFKLNLFNYYFYYNTMELKFESFQIKIFQYLLLKNLILKNKIPIFWCYKCSSSLSYSEIIYKNIKSFSIYFKIKILNFYLIIWTTSIWTMLNNQACFINKKYIYVILKSNNNLIILNNLIYKFFKIIKIKIKIISFIKGIFFINKKYIIFFSKIINFYNFKKIIINNKYIDFNIGTGIIQCSPSNGTDDYLFFKKKNKIYNIYKKNCYINYLFLFKNINFLYINKIIYKILKKRHIILKKIFVFHKYMFCWRHKNYLIYFLSEQIFINFNYCFKKYNIKELIIYNLKKTFFFPNYLKINLINMLLYRNNWCISRQRKWGVIIPFCNYKICSFNKNISKTFSSQFFYYNESKKNIFDVWFDSSISLLFCDNNILLIEGKDQIRGWYQSSIIINFIINFIIKIKIIITHNFFITSFGKKISKSLNNFDLKNIFLNYNSNILKIYLLQHNFTKNIVFSLKKIESSIFFYKKIKIIFSFIINNFYNFNFIKKKILFLDKWIIKKIFFFNKILKKIFFSYLYYKIINILEYLLNFLSNFYFNSLKLRLYISKINSYIRNSIIFSFYNILFFLKRNLFPLTSNFLSYLDKKFFYKKNFYFKNKFSYYIKLKKILNCINIFFFKKKFLLFFFKKEFNIYNIFFINNKFWNWISIYFFLKIKKKIKYCNFSKNYALKNNFFLKKNVCYKCCINKFHNLEEIKFYV
ncbi:isoleucyl-tRNA synthetase [Candidatus Carsonella ruddii CS isolate Thao2000]|uniref:isoleucine--tRNA ligase n=1 Tax=Candidatus Carsonella ruddii CS isolate Thao2000 TaxID=1202537 RepID=J7GSS3_CARRU|nr:class I tRNA ligase family protein [Candidatus Carsonella ruddii]AFP83802.1 isoleucyl-tRNA synthetase [Candidatus Carsonella ruddii CS isolate Thao2000]